MGLPPPLVTVLMPVYNGETHLREAVESILHQTLSDFELLIIIDAATDSSAAIAASFRDPRIRMVENPARLGLVGTLNKGIDIARGAYIARMDCDDISLPERLKRQIDFMLTHPDVKVCGSWIELFGDASRLQTYPAEGKQIQVDNLFYSAMAHPTVVMEKETLQRYGLQYDAGFLHAEDYELWTRAGRLVSFANLQEVLLKYRLHQSQTGQAQQEGQRTCSRRIRALQLRALGIDPDPETLALHESLAYGEYDPGPMLARRTGEWFVRLLEANRRAGVYDQDIFFRTLGERWFRIYRGMEKPLLTWDVWKTFSRSPLFSAVGKGKRARFRKRCLRNAVRNRLCAGLGWTGTR